MKNTISPSAVSKITIIGRGNVGSHLEKAFKQKGLKVNTYSSREDLNELECTDLIIITVKDDHISSTVNKIVSALSSHEYQLPVIVHTSGSQEMNVLLPAADLGCGIGVLYPLQTFTKGIEMKYGDIPFLIEASDNSTLGKLIEFASLISCNISKADSSTRAKYHIGAVLTCNFANHLWALTDEYLRENSLNFDTLLPLLRQTVSKLLITSPCLAQTGPAVRNDTKIIGKHLEMLSDKPQLAKIYSMLSESIIKHYNT
ncbi:MAG: DUF2520 domain-containing protein [Muribaculaceae bacterium]|nr:DUF2520 domain-containing protein [Muribaculaceae bacterium]